LELVHSDVYYVGANSHSGYCYWSTFIDDYSCRKFVPMKHKSDTSSFKTFKAYAENHTGKRFRDDKT
jgi:hypothetical protein